jgi:hypothetical protein
MAASYDHRSGTWGVIKGWEFHEQLSGYQLLPSMKLLCLLVRCRICLFLTFYAVCSFALY